METLNHIRVLLVTGRGGVRTSLVTIFDRHDDMELVGRITHDANLTGLCAEQRPDIIVVDLPRGRDAIARIHTMHRHCPEAHIIALTGVRDERRVQAVLDAGATSYLPHDVAADELATTIRAAYVGRPILVPRAVQVLIHAATARPTLAAVAR